MSEIPRVSLIDTLNLIQLARETALARGADEQADRLKPLVNGMQNLVSQSRQNTPKAHPGIMGQEDFKKMLETAQSKPVAQATDYPQYVAERNQLIQSMAAADMTDLEIARQMQMTREEVNLVLSISERGTNGKGILK